MVKFPKNWKKVASGFRSEGFGFGQNLYFTKKPELFAGKEKREEMGKLTGNPGKIGLYDPQYERDACGMGFVVNIKG